MKSLDIRIEEHESQSETEVTVQALKRSSAILARWALRSGRNALKDAGVDIQNPVTGGGIKGYGGKGESN